MSFTTRCINIRFDTKIPTGIEGSMSTMPTLSIIYPWVAPKKGKVVSFLYLSVPETDE